jgi:hypothetical protein
MATTPNSQELVLVKELGEVKSQLGEIKEALKRQRSASTTTTAQPQPKRREQLSDRELERRYKEWLLQQEPREEEE